MNKVSKEGTLKKKGNKQKHLCVCRESAGSASQRHLIIPFSQSMLISPVAGILENICPTWSTHTHTHTHTGTNAFHALTNCAAPLHPCMQTHTHTCIQLTSENRTNEGFICNFLFMQNVPPSDTGDKQKHKDVQGIDYEPPFSAQFQLLRMFFFFPSLARVSFSVTCYNLKLLSLWAQQAALWADQRKWWRA